MGEYLLAYVHDGYRNRAYGAMGVVGNARRSIAGVSALAMPLLCSSTMFFTKFFDPVMNPLTAPYCHRATRATLELLCL